MSMRRQVNKRSGARKFNKAATKTHPKNISLRPRRGGIRI